MGRQLPFNHVKLKLRHAQGSYRSHAQEAGPCRREDTSRQGAAGCPVLLEGLNTNACGLSGHPARLTGSRRPDQGEWRGRVVV